MNGVLSKSLKSMRQRLISKVIRSTLEGVLRTTRLHPESRSLLDGLEIRTGVPYGPEPEHVLDVYRPANAGACLPTILYVHGGGFRILSKDTHWMMAASFAKAGYTVFNMNYRLAPQSPYPAACEDVARAALWITENAEKYGGDSSGLALAGESAGANLVLAITIANSTPRPEPFARPVFDAEIPIRCVLPACGILQVSDGHRFKRERPDLPVFYGDRIEVVCRGYLQESNPQDSLVDPLVLLETEDVWSRPLPPMMAVVGSRDPIMQDSMRLGRALDRLEVENQIAVYPNGGHAFHALFWRPLSRQVWSDQISFLKTHLPSGL